MCALIAEREIPTIYGNYDYAIARDLEDCGCAYITPHDRELGQRSVDWTLAHTDQALQGLHARAAVRPALRASATGASISCTARRARSTSTSSRTSPPACTSGSPAAENADVLVFGHTHKPWVHEYGGVLFVNCGSVGKPKDGDPRGAFAILDRRQDGRGHDRARRLRRRGGRRRGRAPPACPAEFADKLVAAA